MISGVPEHVDGRMIGITEAAGARLINRDRMWHYVEGIRNWNADLAAPRHPHPARTVLDVVRRHRQAAALAAVSRLRYAGPTAIHHVDRLRLFVVRADPEHHQEGIRAFRLGAESRSHRQELADDGAPRHQQGRARAGGSVQEPRRRFHRARQPRRSRQRHECARRRQSAEARTSQGPDRGARPRDIEIPTSRTRR